MTPVRIRIARLFLFVRETVARVNSGAWVEAIQRVTGNKAGDPWCASFVSVVLALAYRGNPPLPRTASCQELLDYASAHGMIARPPQAGDVYLLLDGAGHAHHTGFVTKVLDAQRIEEISGNTNMDGSRDGYGVFERTGASARWINDRIVFIRLPAEPAEL